MENDKKNIRNYVCPSCFERLENCKCKFAPWSLMMVDENIQEVIRILNQKAYITNGCCESHYDGNPILYVSFIEPYNIGLPEGFAFSKQKTCIDYVFKKKELTTKEKYEELKAKKLNALLEWAKSLPDRYGRG